MTPARFERVAFGRVGCRDFPRHGMAPGVAPIFLPGGEAAPAMEGLQSGLRIVLANSAVFREFRAIAVGHAVVGFSLSERAAIAKDADKPEKSGKVTPRIARSISPNVHEAAPVGRCRCCKA